MANHPTAAMSRKEADLANRSRIALESGKVQDGIEQLQHLCLARGATGKTMTKSIFSNGLKL